MNRLKKIIRKVLIEGIQEEASEEDWKAASVIAEKLMFTGWDKHQEVADQMSNGRYSSDPDFGALVDDIYEMLEADYDRGSP